MDVDRPLHPPAADPDPAASAEAATVDIDESGGAAVIRVDGDLDAVAAPDVQAALFEVIGRCPGGVRVDMAGIAFLDSVGISVLVAARNRADEVGTGFELAAVPPACLRVLEITRLTEVFTIVD
jgi:anti-anti-sigma factor